MNAFAPHIALILLVFSQFPGGGMVGSEYFSVRYGPGEDKLARAVENAALSAREQLKDRLGITMDARVMILIAPGGKKEFQAAQPGETPVPEWAIGTAYPKNRTIILRRPDNLDFRYEDLRGVVAHEYVHVAVHDFIGDLPVPRWLDEGLASWVAGERTFTASTTLGIAALSGNIIHLRELADSWPQSRSQADLAYAESADFVSWLETEYGRGSVGAILRLYRKSGNLDAALDEITSHRLDELEAIWLSRVKRRYVWIPILSGGVSLWFLMTLLFLMGYYRKRRRSALKMKQWEIEEELQTLNSSRDDETSPPKPMIH